MNKIISVKELIIESPKSETLFSIKNSVGKYFNLYKETEISIQGKIIDQWRDVITFMISNKEVIAEVEVTSNGTKVEKINFMILE